MVIPLEGCEDEVLVRLARHEVIAVPGPRPFPYVICATSSEAVNDAKDRQSAQSVIVMLDDLQKIRPYTALDDKPFEFAALLALAEKVHLLLPHSQALPDLYKGATRDGYLGVSTAWHDGLRFMLSMPSPVFASSANASGKEPSTSASDVDTLFQGKLLVVRDPASDGKQSQSGAIIRVSADSSIELVRTGFQVAASGQPPEEYARHLTERSKRWQAEATKF